MEREARTITIHALELLGVASPDASLRVRCSKGTYVRTLAEDLARALGSCAHLTALRRTAVAPFPAASLVQLADLEADPDAVPLLPADAALPQLPEVHLDEFAARKVRQGNAVQLESEAGLPMTLVRLYAPGRRFMGVGRREPCGESAVQVQPVRLFNDLGPDST